MFLNLRRAVSVLLTFCIVSVLIYTAPVSAAAEEYLSSCVDLATANQNMSGKGYTWANRTSTLTLDSLKVKTTDEYGLRIPKNATLILNGDSYVEAASIAVTALLSLTIQGSGSLTMVAGDTGLKMISPDTTAALRITGGKLTIRAGKTGIQSDYPSVAVGNTARLDISITEEDGKAIRADILQLNSGTLTADAALTAVSYIKIGGCALTVASRSGPALYAPEIRISEGNSLKTGSDSDHLTSTDQYNNEACVSFDPKPYVKKSIILGDKYAAEWDYVLLAGVLILLALVIALPIIHQYRKNQRKKAEIEARRASEKAERVKKKRIV